MNILELDSKLPLNKELCEAPNISEWLDDEQLQCIASAVWEGYQADLNSRSAWERRTSAAMDLAMQLQKEKTFPWPNASNVIFPLVTISALQFAARAYSNLIQGTDVVRYRLAGPDPTGEVVKRATRVGRHMSWQVLEEDEAWEEQHDKLLINLAVVGTAFIKTYWSASCRHNVSELVPARDLVVDYWAKSLESAQRVTQVTQLSRNQIYERVRNGSFTDILSKDWYVQPASTPAQINSAQQAAVDRRAGIAPSPSDASTPFTFLEQHRYLDLDGDGYAEPYIVTMEYASKTIVRIVARWEQPEDVIRSGRDVLTIKATHYFTKYSFIPSPDGGFYDMGFGLFLGPINETVNTGINQLLDNGTMQNSLGGFLGRGAKIRGGIYTMAPWEWKRVDSPGDDLRKNMVPFPERQPSNVTFQLIGLLINYADRLAGTVGQAVGENPGQNTPASTARDTLAEGMKVHTMIFKRVWRSMREEFRKLYTLNGSHLQVSQNFGANDEHIRQEDYHGGADLIAPVADPNISSSEMRMQQAAAVVQRSAEAGGGYDPEVVERQFLQALQVENIDQVYPGLKKMPASPNRFIAVEQMKQQGHMAKYKHEQQRWANELLEERRLNSAKIAQLEAQALALLATADAAQAGVLIQRFDSAINAHKVVNEQLTARIEALQAGSSGSEGEGNDGGESGTSPGGALAAMAGGSDDPAMAGDAGGMEAGADGAMGSGGV